METESLMELYVDELKDLYSAENQLLKALPKMVKAATHPELKKAFADHLEQTRGHVERLEQLFEKLEKSPKGKKCKGMEGLIEEGKELIEEDPATDVLDAGLISKAQHVEHYEMAGYGTVRTWARQLGLDDQADLLQETLDEEGEADHLLTQIAESSINLDAETGANAEDSDEESDETSTSDRPVRRAAVKEGGRGATKSGARKSRSTSSRSSESRAR